MSIASPIRRSSLEAGKSGGPSIGARLRELTARFLRRRRERSRLWARSTFSSPGTVLRWVLTIALGAVFVFPLYWTLVLATGQLHVAYQIPPVLVPAFNFRPMEFILTHTHWLRYMLNSVVITGLTIVMVLVTSILAGYAFAELKFRGRETLFIVVLGGMMLPGQALLVTQFIVNFHLGLLNTYLVLLVPFATSGGSIFLFRQFFKRLPTEYREAARLEGASTLYFLRRVAVPMARPAVATSILLTFISAWNMFQWPLIMLNSNRFDPIEVALERYTGPFQAHMRDLTSAAVLALFPIVVMYALTQKHIVRAVAGGDTGVNG